MIAIGLMSGTSADGIDAALVQIRGAGESARFTLLAFKTYPYPKGFREILLRNSNAETARLDEVTRLNTLIAELFAGAAKKIARAGRVSLDEVRVIGSHGQTIQHQPELRKMFGVPVRGTLQIGDPSIMAKRTGVLTVGDFRTADVGVGGTGAPLVPYVDYLAFKSTRRNRAVLNIGGIANITLLPAGGTVHDVLAFDTGPGNMLIDGAMQTLYNKPFDAGGKIASQGRIIPELIAELIRDSYYAQKPPKSTGRERYGVDVVHRLIKRYGKRSNPADIVASLTEFTALSIQQAVARFGKRVLPLHDLFVSGGGVRNQFLMESLSGYFAQTNIRLTDDAGFPTDAKEAICFTILANETLNGIPSNVPGATGAKKRTVLGKICLP